MTQSVCWVRTTPEGAWHQESITPLPTAGDTLEVTGERHQAIEGFGGCFNELGWIALQKLPARERAAEN